jgi:hypothetical protein
MVVVSVRDLERIGLSLEPEEFEQLVAEAVRHMPPARRPRDTDIPEFDPETRAALERGGLGFAPPDLPRSPLASAAARYAALLATARPVAEAARLLGVDPSRVRQRLGERTLYGVKAGRGWRLPAFQFDLDQPDRLVPGIGAVLAALPRDLHPVAVYNWLTLPDPDLIWQGEPVSPLDWLRSGGDPETPAAIAADL